MIPQTADFSMLLENDTFKEDIEKVFEENHLNESMNKNEFFCRMSPTR